ncbi:MAG: hypothetical protein Q4C71_05730 [Microbacteriaceae bacterium]|nr:hypothetical protein [Microbacteriaceae bacterium]
MSENTETVDTATPETSGSEQRTFTQEQVTKIVQELAHKASLDANGVAVPVVRHDSHASK